MARPVITHPDKTSSTLIQIAAELHSFVEHANYAIQHFSKEAVYGSGTEETRAVKQAQIQILLRHRDWARRLLRPLRRANQKRLPEPRQQENPTQEGLPTRPNHFPSSTPTHVR